MNCCYTINGKIFETSEAEFIGILCSILDTFLHDVPFDVEVSCVKDCILLPELPRSWTLKNKLTEITTFCDKLRQTVGPTGIEVIPLGNKDFKPKMYYIPENFIHGFMIGYAALLSLSKEFASSSNEGGANHNDTAILDYECSWEPDQIFINKSKFVSGPDDKIINKRYFIMNIPCYLWDLPVDPINDMDTYMEQIIVNFVNLFLSKCSQSDHELLMLKNHYLRIFQYQDKPDSDRYVYMRLQSIDDCTFKSHIESLRSVPKDRLPCELNYTKRGYFFEFPVSEWKSKRINHIMQFV